MASNILRYKNQIKREKDNIVPQIVKKSGFWHYITNNQGSCNAWQLGFSSPAVNQRLWTLLRNTEEVLEALTNFVRFYDITQNNRTKATFL